MSIRPEFLFIHIAKTGGFTIRSMLRERDTGTCRHCIHNNSLIISNGTKIVQRIPLADDFCFEDYRLIAYFVRNPYERLLSCYDWFYAGGLNQYAGNRFAGDERMQQRVQEQFPTFEHCCRNLGDFCTLVPHARPMSVALPLQVSSFSGILFEGRYESFNQDVMRLFDLLDITISPNEIAHLNKMSENRRFPYSDHLRSMIYDFFKEDFVRFGYAY